MGHFDLTSWVTGGIKIRPGIPSNGRIFESLWFSISKLIWLKYSPITWNLESNFSSKRDSTFLIKMTSFFFKWYDSISVRYPRTEDKYGILGAPWHGLLHVQSFLLQQSAKIMNWTSSYEVTVQSKSSIDTQIHPFCKPLYCIRIIPGNFYSFVITLTLSYDFSWPYW